jgi:hypothetical protein
MAQVGPAEAPPVLMVVTRLGRNGYKGGRAGATPPYAHDFHRNCS